MHAANCPQLSDVCCQTVSDTWLNCPTSSDVWPNCLLLFACSQTAAHHLTSCQIVQSFVTLQGVLPSCYCHPGLLPNCHRSMTPITKMVINASLYDVWPTCSRSSDVLTNYSQSSNVWPNCPRSSDVLQIVHNHLMYGQTVPHHLMHCHLSPDVLHIVKLSTVI